MELEFTGEIVHWRGPAPFHFVDVPEPHRTTVAEAAAELTYGWGCIPVTAAVGATGFTTSLFPKDGGYLVPIKAAVRRAEGVELGDVVRVRLDLNV